jgi:voltage-gated potassium channel
MALDHQTATAAARPRRPRVGLLKRARPLDAVEAGRHEVSFVEVLATLLSGYVLLQLLIEAILPLSADTKAIMGYADHFVCGVFLLDFIARFRAAPSKIRFMRWGWIDLASSIPVGNWLLLGRFARVLRLVRVLRALRSMQRLVRVLLKNRIPNTFLALTTVAVLLIATCGAAMLALERDAKDANITSVPDALWWATSTVTTVGYGDRFPVTGEGRVVAVVLMVAGVGLFGTLSGTIAASMMGPKPEEAETAQLLREMKVLRAELAELKATLNAGEEKRG